VREGALHCYNTLTVTVSATLENSNVKMLLQLCGDHVTVV